MDRFVTHFLVLNRKHSKVIFGPGDDNAELSLSYFFPCDDRDRCGYCIRGLNPAAAPDLGILRYHKRDSFRRCHSTTHGRLHAPGRHKFGPQSEAASVAVSGVGFGTPRAFLTGTGQGSVHGHFRMVLEMVPRRASPRVRLRAQNMHGSG